MKGRDVPLDRLLGRKVIGRDNKPAGRIEEFRAEPRNGGLEVTDYVLGASGLLERLGLGVWTILGVRSGGHLARWDQVDITDPERPRLTCPVEDLRKL